MKIELNKTSSTQDDHMAIGKSNRIVIEIDPAMKSNIYIALKARGLTLKEWFIKKALEDLLTDVKHAEDHE